MTSKPPAPKVGFDFSFNAHPVLWLIVIEAIVLVVVLILD